MSEVKTTAQRWQRVKSILADALELEKADERTAFLEDSCDGDTTLMREVEALLAQSTQRLDELADNTPTAFVRDGPAQPTGRRIGAYEVVREIGRGGMGAVYLAKRADGQFEKEVAIKLLKRGTDTDEILRRFQGERRILARLDHRNIARLLDAGTTDDGLPYLVMECVLGNRITEFVRERELSISDRLRLFLKICDAVECAHQNLVVHRDLKPGNILINAEGEPKLLDFGIAKLLAPGDDWEVTTAGRERLTPSYASPEQVRGEPVTTVSDVYALGALLFEILTGHPPHRFPSGTPPSEILRVVCEQEPPRPSTAVKDTAEGRQLRGDLDNIVLRALAKNPVRRYSSAGNLADDLSRYLEGRPVRARPVTFRYRAAKFLGRHKAGSAAVAVLLVTILAGVIATLRQAHIANRERNRAERRFAELRGLATSFLFELNDAIEQQPTQARKLLVQHARDYLDNLLEDAATDVSLKRQLATAYQKLGDVESQLHKANLGDTTGALDSYRKALALRESLFDSRGPGFDEVELRLELALSYSRLGDILAKTGNTTGALVNYRKALPLLESAASDPGSRPARLELASNREVIGRTLLRTGDMAGALVQYQSALEISESLAAEKPNDPLSGLGQTKIYFSLGYLLAARGQKEEGLKYYHRALTIMRTLSAADPTNPTLRRSLMNSHWWVGIGFQECAKLVDARHEYDQALALCQFALGADPANIQAHNDLADIQNSIGDVLFLQSDAAGAREYHSLARENYQRVAAADSLNIHAQRQVWYSEEKIAEALALTGGSPAALAKLRETLNAFQRLTATDPSNTEFQRDEARCEEDIAQLLAKTGRAESAEDYLHKAVPIYETLLSRSPENADARNDLARAKAELAQLEHETMTR